MLNNSEQLRRLEEIVAPVCRAHGVQLVDARFTFDHGIVLKVIIERPQADGMEQSGVSLADCQAVNQDLLTVMDVYDERLPPGDYRLEVSSPGLDRPLFKLEDFRRFEGREVKIQTKKSIQKRKKFRGILQKVVGESIQVELDGVVVEIPHVDISKANLVYRF